MHRFFTDYKVEELKSKEIYITDRNDIKHLAKALRIEIGEDIEVCDKVGEEFICKVLEITDEKVTCEILSRNSFVSRFAKIR